MKHIRNIIATIPLFLLISCGTHRNLPHTHTQIKDSTIIRETIQYKDTLIHYSLPPDITMAAALIGTIATDTLTVQTTAATAKAWMQNDTLKLRLRNNPHPLKPLKISLPITARTESHYKIHTEIQTVEVNKITKFQRLLMNLGWGFVGVLILVVVLRFVRK